MLNCERKLKQPGAAAGVDAGAGVTGVVGVAVLIGVVTETGTTLTGAGVGAGVGLGAGAGETVNVIAGASIPPTDHVSVHVPTVEAVAWPVNVKFPFSSVEPYGAEPVQLPMLAVLLTGEFGGPVTVTSHESPT